MFRLHRSKASKSGERIDFRFTNFQANQVPKGWDKLFVSIISVETGKTLAKSSKALVRNGSCLWREALTESIWVTQDHSSKELEDSSFKFVVAMGSSRSGILGEATVNVTGYIESTSTVPLSLPLKKCSHGTTLLVNLHCSAPKNKLRKGGGDDASSHSGDLNADFDAKSDGSQGSFARSFGSSSGKDPDSNSQPGETPSRATSFSASDSRRSSISADGSTGRGTFSPRNIMNTDKYSSVVRQDSTGLPKITPNGSVENSTQSNFSSLSSKDAGTELGQIALLKNVGSSKSLLKTAENTIEEIQAEAKMWERTARKLMLDLDILKKEVSDQSLSKANLELELSAAHTESDGLKKEIQQLELLLEEMKTKQKASEYSTSRRHIEKGLEAEIKFNRESNSELALQLKKAQESNIELVSILQELEETIETQKVEIQELSDLKSKFSNTDCSIHEGLEGSRTLIAQLQCLQESEKLLLEKVQSLERDLKEKTSELEIERSLRSQPQQNELNYSCKLSDKDDKILGLEAKLSVFLEKGCADEITPVDGDSTYLKIELEALKEKVKELERDCTELTDENLELLFKLKKSQNSFEKEGNLHEFSTHELSSKSYISSGSDVGETEVHNTEAEMEKRLRMAAETEVVEASKICSEIFKQLQIAFSLVNNPLQNIQKYEYDRMSAVIDNQIDVEDEVSCKEMADLILRHMTEFNKALDALIIDCSGVKVREDEIRKQNAQILESHEEFEASVGKVHELSFTVQETVNLRTQLEEKNIKIIEQKSQIEKLEASLHSIEEVNEVLVQRKKELEAISDELKGERARVQGRYEAVSMGSTTTSKCLNDLQNELLALNSSLNTQVSANKILEEKMGELEIKKQDQELHLSELERENVQLSERISGLEAQLRYLTNEKESTCMELEKSQRFVSTLQDQLFNASTEMEQKLSDQKDKMEEVQKKFLEHQEEIEYMNASNSKLQTTAENVMEECDSLQKSNAKLRSQKLELYEQCTRLEAELRQMKEKFASCSKNVENLENKLSLMLEDFSSTEKMLTSELGALLEEHRQHREQLVFGESLLNQLYEDKTLEAERLQKEVNHLTQQIYSTHDERENMASDAVQEVSRLSEDNAKLVSVLQEAQSKTIQLEYELNNLQTKSSMKVQSLMVEIATLKQGHEIMMADSEKMTKLMEKCKSSEDRLKTSFNNLELRLNVSEYERQQLLEESTGLKIHMEKIENLKDEITSLKSALKTAKLEKDKLESSLQLMTCDCETQKVEKMLLSEKISTLEKAASAYEDCKRNKNSLEEKLLRLEGDIVAKEATCAQNVELKNELGRIKSENRQLQRKIEKLEEENDRFLKNNQVADEGLKLLKEAKHVQNIKNESLESTNQRRISRRKASFNINQGQEHLQSEQTANNTHYQGQAENGNKFNEVGSESLSRIQTLENDLADALEATNLYKLQLKRLSEGNNHTMTRSKSSLEAELRDIKERYLHMSLKYAEGEAQREELVMKLKAARSGKKWF